MVASSPPTYGDLMVTKPGRFVGGPLDGAVQDVPSIDLMPVGSYVCGRLDQLDGTSIPYAYRVAHFESGAYLLDYDLDASGGCVELEVDDRLRLLLDES